MLSFLKNLTLNEISVSQTVQEFLSPKGVLYIVMNRPEVHNAFNEEQISLITQALLRAENNTLVKLIVLASTGKSFCAGGNINYMRRMGQNSFEENKKDGLALAKLMHTLYSFPKPTIARVQGATFGGGVGLVCCCDIAIGTKDVKLTLSEVKLGLIASTISPYVVYAVGERAAKRLLLTAETLTAEKSLHYGLLSEIVETKELDNYIDELAHIILRNGPEAVKKTKHLVLEISRKPINQEVIEFTAESIANVRSTPEAKEGLSAFLEKRKPKWE